VTTTVPSRVFVVQDDGQKNLLPALKFGSIEPLITGRDQQLYNTAPLVAELKIKLASFTENDYLMLVGDPAAIAICAMIAAQKTSGKLKLLKWDRQERTYYVLNVYVGSN